MKPLRTTTLIAVSALLLACPPSPKDEEGDSVADEAGPEPAPPTSTDGASPPAETSGSTDGAEAGSCEEQLAKVKAQLAACEQQK